jgi:hypothetical protein
MTILNLQTGTASATQQKPYRIQKLWSVQTSFSFMEKMRIFCHKISKHKIHLKVIVIDTVSVTTATQNTKIDICTSARTSNLKYGTAYATKPAQYPYLQRNISSFLRSSQPSSSCRFTFQQFVRHSDSTS